MCTFFGKDFEFAVIEETCFAMSSMGIVINNRLAFEQVLQQIFYN